MNVSHKPSMSVSHTGMLPMPGTSTSERVSCIKIIIARYGEPPGCKCKRVTMPEYWILGSGGDPWLNILGANMLPLLITNIQTW